MTNNSSSVIVVADLTVAEQWIQYIFFYIGFGILGAIGNIALATGIIRSKDLRSRFFIVICTVVLVRITIAYQFIVIGLFRALKALHIVEVNQKRITCHFIHFFIHVSFSVELSLLFVLVIDRMLAIIAPVVYRRLTRRQAKGICLITVLVVAVCKAVPSFVGWGDHNEAVACMNVFSTVTPKMSPYFQNMDLALTMLVLSMYCLLWTYLKVHVKPLKRQNIVEGQLHLKRRMTLLPLLRNTVFAHTIVTLTAKCLTSVVVWFPEQSFRLVAYSGNLNTIDLILNIVILMWSHNDLRKAAVPGWCRRENSAPNGTARDLTNPIGVAPKTNM